MSKIFASFPDSSSYNKEYPDPTVSNMWISKVINYTESFFHDQFNDMAQFTVTP